MRAGGVRPRRVAILPRQVAVEAREEVWVILLTHVDIISPRTPEGRVGGRVGLTFIDPKSMSGVLATSDQPVNGILVNGKRVVVELDRRIGVALAVEDALVPVGVVGEKILVQTPDGPCLERDGGRPFKELAKGGIELFHVPAKVNCVQLEDVLALPQRNDFGRGAGVFVVVTKCWEGIGVLVGGPKVGRLLEDLRGLVGCPGDCSRDGVARVRVCLDVEMGDNAYADPTGSGTSPEEVGVLIVLCDHDVSSHFET